LVPLPVVLLKVILAARVQQLGQLNHPD